MAEARIDSPPNKEVNVKEGSDAELSCVVDMGSGIEEITIAAFWYLDGQPIDCQFQTGFICTKEIRGHRLISTLVIVKAALHHAGNFTCSIPYAKPDTVTLHVIDGKAFKLLKVSPRRY